MTKIKSYKKNNETFYEFQLYIGIDPLTGKKRKTRRRGFKSEKEALLQLARLEIQVADGEFEPQKKKQTFEDLFKLWFIQYKNTVKESSWATTQRIFRLHIIPIFGSYLVDQITVMECQKAVNQWFNAGLAQYPRFINYTAKVLDYAISMQLITVNPAKQIILPRKKNNDAVRHNIENYYDSEELEHFFECLKDADINPQAYVFFRLAAFSGMRKSEMLALKWSDVDFEHDAISVNKTQSRGENNRLVVQSPKTPRSYRTVFIEPKTTQILRQWKKKQAKYLQALGFPLGDNLVFSNEQNEMFQPVKPQVWLKYVIDNYDLKKVTVHAFRHTYATLSYEAGANPIAVKEQLGHSSLKTTFDVYTATTHKESNEATKKLAAYLKF
ncbi:site-specific integrase [Lentilactobacillus fungorum]|uniref:Site-specific integrase n=1 Tax=Lentilactobacillus fungorum TaxID=2201250 RepID=A0ABQ3W3A7_9LACO|nr:site-specific integrase [Lentilactobacillus fungorum]GHP15255.1 site-specific integrase [Lentilactobacillus fungorum]